MQKYEKLIEGYQQQQVKLRAQISALRARKMGASRKTEGDAAAAIRRTERQIADLDRAIAKCREKALGSS